MELKKYSTKEMCDLFDIGRETLRHYERLGLIDPHINEDNGYREYSYWDVATMIDVLRYRSFGISLSDIKHLLNDLDYPDIIDALDHQNDYYIQQMLHYRYLQKKTARDINYLKLGKEHMGEIVELNVGDFFFVPYTTDPTNEYFPALSQAFHNSQFFVTGLAIDGNKHDLSCYGMVTEKEFSDYLGIEKGIVINGSKAVCQMIDVVGRTPITDTIANDFKEKVANVPGINLDTVYAILMSRFYDKEKRYHQYFFVFAKIDDTSKGSI